MVQHPHGIDTLGSGKGALLPINPPEITPLILERVMNLLKVDFEELSVGWVKENRLGCQHGVCMYVRRRLTSPRVRSRPSALQTRS
jgi:hypothetical protein